MEALALSTTFATKLRANANAKPTRMAVNATNVSPVFGIIHIAVRASVTTMQRFANRRLVFVSIVKITQMDQTAKGFFFSNLSWHLGTFLTNSEFSQM